jgi:DNA-binding SARP family transcriptional activator
LEFRVLGPVEVRVAGGRIDIGPRRQCAVLAALAVDAGQPVLVDTIIDRVWGREPPDRVRHALYVYIARIRRILAEASTGEQPPARVTHRSGGYLLDVDHDHVDAHRFRALTDQARRPQCPDTQRVTLLRRALDLWRGTPLGDLPGAWAAQVRQGWQRQRIDAATLWARAQLRLGHADRILGPLSDLITEHPTG